jgi:hypothetical protein
MARVVRCTIEMDLVEGDHFPASNLKDPSDFAVSAFVDMSRQAIEGENGWTLDQDSWVQTRLIEDAS